MNAGNPYEAQGALTHVAIRRFEGEYRATPRAWLIRRLIRKIRRGGSIWGLPGQGKGVVVVMLAIALLYGFEVAGRKAERIERLLYVDGEDDEAEFGNRVVAACKGWEALLGRPVEVPSAERLVYMNIGVDDFRDPMASSEVRERVGEVGADVVIYDALQSIFGGNQNTGEVGGFVWGWIQRTAVEFEHVPLVIDHSGWAGKHEAGTVQKRGRVGQSLQVGKRTEGVEGDGEWQIVDIYMRKSNYQVSPGEETPVLSVRFTFTRTPCLIDGEHDEPDDCMGPTLIEFVDAPAPGMALIGLIIELLEERGEMAETELAETLGKSSDAIRMAVTREQKRGNPDAKRLSSTKTRPKRWSLEG